MLLIGTAGWSIPKAETENFTAEGSGLARYASRFACVEINSTFKQLHRPATLARWTETVPDAFRFSVKLPKAITHERRLVDCGPALEAFVASLAPLGSKLGPLLVQLPPAVALDPAIALSFFETLRSLTDRPIVCEPRHATWFSAEADDLLRSAGVARVAADPARVPQAGEPGGATELIYLRLHGAPRVYYSAYDDAFLKGIAALLQSRGTSDAWCIFDNTASGAATTDALRLKSRLGA